MKSLDPFLARWSASGDAERANKDSFLNELCDVLGVERPHPMDRYREAEELLPQVESRADPGNELDGIRLRWLQGRTRAGMGRREEALPDLSGMKLP